MKLSPESDTPLSMRVVEMKQKGAMKKSQPHLHISAHIDDYDPPDDDKYHKEQLARITKRIRTIKSQLGSWDNEKAGALAKASLENELQREKLRLQEQRLRAS